MGNSPQAVQNYLCKIALTDVMRGTRAFAKFSIGATLESVSLFGLSWCSLLSCVILQRTISLITSAD